MAISLVFFRRVAAIILFMLLGALALATARVENVAALSPRMRSDIVLQRAAAAGLNAKALRRYARQIAMKDPMHSAGFVLEVLALEKDKIPTSDKQRRLIMESARRQPSLAAPRIWLISDDIQKGRYAQAVESADTVMRLNDEFRKLLTPHLVPLLAEEQARPLLEKKLREFPVWRADFVTEAIKMGGYEPVIERVLQQRAPRGAEAMLASERSAYLRDLVRSGEAVRAHTLWRNFAKNHGGSGLVDGNFTEKNPIYPFAWEFASGAYSYAGKAPAIDGAPPVIRAHQGGDGNVSLLTQVVALQPGAHDVVITMRDGGLSKPEKLFWQLRCLDVNDNLASHSLEKLAPDWQKIRLSVMIPAAGCPLQYLMLNAENNDDKESEVEIRSVEVE